MALPVFLSDILQKRAEGRSRLAWFREVGLWNHGTISDLKLRFWPNGEREYLADLLDDQVSPVNELRLEALIRNIWPLQHQTDLAPSAVRNGSAAWYAADRVQNETLLADDFNRANGPLGSVPGPGDPVAWQVFGGTAEIQGAKLATTSGTPVLVLPHVEAGTADLTVTTDITIGATTTGRWGCAVRLIDANNFIYAAFQPDLGSVVINKRDGGAYTVLATFTFPSSSGSTYGMRLVTKGDLVRLFIDGSFVGAVTLSGADYTKFGAATKAGLISTSPATFDNFTVRTLAPSTDLAAAVDTFDRSTAAEIIDLSGTRAGGTGTALRLPGTAGNFLTVTGLQPAWDLGSTKNLDVSWRNDTAYSSNNTVVGTEDGTGGWRVRHIGTGTYQLRIYDSGGTLRASSALAGATKVHRRLTWDRSTNIVTLWHRDSEGDAWGSVATTSHGPFTVAAATIRPYLGANSSGAADFAPALYRHVTVTVDGTVVASPDFTAQAAGTTSFTDAQGNTWTVNQSHGSIGSTETGEAAALAYTTHRSGAGDVFYGINGKLQSATGTENKAYVAAGLADLDVAVDMIQAFSNSGVLWRLIDSSNFLLVTLNNTTLSLWKRDGGSYTTLTTAAVTAGDARLRVINVGDRIWVYVNGALSITYTLSGADQTKYGAATNVGIYSASGSIRFDNFRVSRPPLVACWPDLSGKHRHAVQTTLAKQPVLLTNIKNGRPVVRPDGVDDFLLSSGTFSPVLSQPNTLLAATRPLSFNTATFVFDGSNRLGWTASGVRAFAGSNLTGATAVPSNVWRQSGAILKGASSVIRLNGVTDQTGDAGTNALGTNGTIGALTNGTSPVHADIGEIIVTDADLSATGDLWLAEDYLLRRWIN